VLVHADKTRDRIAGFTLTGLQVILCTK
jgi:hypothetical protein